MKGTLRHSIVFHNTPPLSVPRFSVPGASWIGAFCSKSLCHDSVLDCVFHGWRPKGSHFLAKDMLSFAIDTLSCILYLPLVLARDALPAFTRDKALESTCQRDKLANKMVMR